MPQYTDRWALSILGPGDSIQDEGYKFSDADRRLIDRLLTIAVETHHHTGGSTADNTPTIGPTLTLQTTGGSMLGGSRYYYAFTVLDEYGNESGPSPVANIDIPVEVTAPQAPSPLAITGTGSLLPGSYSYAASACKGPNTVETKAINSATVRIPGVATANSIQLTLPDLPLGATGINIYRKTPNGLHYLFLTSVPNPTKGQIWLDDGTVDEDCDRSLPAANRTSAENMVYVTYPGATPSIPTGWSWNVYRTDNPNDWGRSYLATINPQGATPVTPTTYPDTGVASQVGGPPTKAQIIAAPPKVNLTDAAEVTGVLPAGRAIAPHIITFTDSGPVSVGQGTFVWVCEYDEIEIRTCRAYLSPGSTPAATAVIVDINASRPSQGLPAWTTIYTNQANRPRVIVGQTIGTPTTPDITRLLLGDMLSIDRDQAGGGATPTDLNLAVNILFTGRGGSTTLTLA